ncbi:MAG TPA: asparaginase [Beijerinckiaceae bacterium]|nr:asparaginase [Beijerinckiaceae bacterium]
MSEPVLVEVTRGGIVESAHRGTLVVADADGRIVAALGDGERRAFPRSAVKALQALVLMESGAADRFGLDDADIALACASHSGEEVHATQALSMLKKAGQTATCLECGAHWPMREEAARALAAAGRKPSALHNNCSGKHAGFICAAVTMGEDPKGYVRPDHPLQRAVTAALETSLGLDLSDAPRGVDGCSIPTYAVPLAALARGFARFGTGMGYGRERARAAARIRQAVAAAPFMVAGSNRFDTTIMRALGQRAFVKTGAEGVYCAALPEQGLGIALKIDDGAKRASAAVMASLIAACLPLDAAQGTVVAAAMDTPLVNWNGIEVGRVRPSAAVRALSV